MTGATDAPFAVALPEFPSFKALELSDRAAITSITGTCEPYSDFNFVSLWCWDVDSSTQVSILDGNLVIRLRDYLSGEPTLTTIGPDVTPDHVRELLHFAEATDCECRLELVPECVAQRLSGVSGLLVHEDPDHADYILGAERNASLRSKQFAEHRRLVRLFERSYGLASEWSMRPLSEALPDLDLLAVFDDWLASCVPAEDPAIERCAIARLESVRHVAPLTVVDVQLDGKARGFSVLEDVGAGVFVIHFEKADRRFKGLPSRLAQMAARCVASRGGRFINIEQDLGIAGLRASKRGERPITHLRKYVVEMR